MRAWLCLGTFWMWGCAPASISAAFPAPKDSPPPPETRTTPAIERSPETIALPALAPPPPDPPKSQNGWTRGRGGRQDADYIVRVGIGFEGEALEVLERAVRTWVEATGLPLTVRPGYGPVGDFHLVREIPVCGQRWVYDGYLGCYDPRADDVILNQHGIDFEGDKAPDLLYVVLVHEIGHWLGLGHAEPGENSIMQPDYPSLITRGHDFRTIGELDRMRTCEINPCAPDPSRETIATH